MGAPGCDDAPIIHVEKLPDARHVTVIYPYYENPHFFAKQLGYWSALPDHLRSHLRFIVVDDCSPANPAEQVVRSMDMPIALRLFRIEEDRRWNWLAARNIGFSHADDGWNVCSDIDHMIPEETFETIVYGKLDDQVIYRFSRREHTGQAIHPHPNSWLMTRSMYWKVGGYDETLSGLYGTDGDYRRRCAATAPIRILEDQLVRYEYQDDSSTTHYKRKQPEDAAVKRLVRARPRKGWKPKVLSFPYHQVL